MRIPLLFLPTLLGKVAAGASPGCVSDEGKAVDWFLAMKMPNGGSYHYFDAVTKSFALSEKDMSKGGDCVDQTLSSLYSSDKEKDAYGMWSDQPTHDKAAGSIYAHSKGIFHVDEKQGWYVLHSMPSFPTAQSLGYQELPDVKYGQTFLCMTMEAGEFDKLGSDLQTMHAYFYDSFYSEELEELIPNMVNATNKVENKDEQAKETVFSTVGGQKFTHFAKGRYWGKELYEDLIAPSLKKDLATETWQNGSYDNVVQTSCPPKFDYTVSNVLDLKFGDDVYKSTQDHSKWAITTKGFDNDTGNDRSACIGGINRQVSQSERGGASMCIESLEMNDELFDVIVNYEDCP